MKDKQILKTREFVKNAFIENPHYSFNHWSVMYNHSVLVFEFAEKLLSEIKADREIVLIGALLHDIGKTYNADPETLHKKHEDLNLEVANDFIESLDLDKISKDKIKEIISFKNGSLEEKIIKDADALAFFHDKILYSLFLDWAKKEGLEDAIDKKINKFNSLNFKISKKIAEKDYQQMLHAWKNI